MTEIKSQTSETEIAIKSLLTKEVNYTYRKTLRKDKEMTLR